MILSWKDSGFSPFRYVWICFLMLRVEAPGGTCQICCTSGTAEFHISAIPCSFHTSSNFVAQLLDGSGFEIPSHSVESENTWTFILISVAAGLRWEPTEAWQSYRTFTCATPPCCDVTRFGRDDHCCCHPLFFKERLSCSHQHSMHQKILSRDRSLRQVRDKYDLGQPLQYVLRPSTTGSDPHMSARSVTPIPISFDALREDPVPLKGCALWNRRAFMVRIMACAKDKRWERVWSRDEQKTEQDEHAFDRNPDPPNTSRKYFPVMRLSTAGLEVAMSTSTSTRRARVSNVFRSGRGREWCHPPGALHFLQSAEYPHLIDASSTVTCLVHGQTDESQSVGCSLEPFCCGRVIETPDGLYKISYL